jgi:hypothetical protein
MIAKSEPIQKMPKMLGTYSDPLELVKIRSVDSLPIFVKFKAGNSSRDMEN